MHKWLGHKLAILNAQLCKRLAVALSAGALGIGAACATDVSLVDDRHREIRFEQPPLRIVSLLPSLTETICVLGACERLVGVDRYSNWPQATLSQLPVVGGGLDPNVEAIVALRPDVVVLSNSARVVERLEMLGLRTVTLEPRTQADVRRVVHVLGHMLGLPKERAEQEWVRLQAGIDAAAQTVPKTVHGARVYFEVSRGPFVAGPTSFIGEMLQRMHVQNVIPSELGPFPRVSPEFLVRANPEIILMGSHSMQVAHTYPGWQRMDAVKHQRVCAFSADESGVIVRPGPRMDEAARIIARCLAQKAPSDAK